MTSIKKYKNNEYSRTQSGIWVHNPTVGDFPVDINNLTSEKDYKLFIDNEIALKSLKLMRLEDFKTKHVNCVIVSDGYGFQEKQEILKDIKQKHVVIGINKSLKKWNPKISKMDYYVVNNPYPECVSYLPSVRYFPTCIIASRTNPKFVSKYKGNIVKYIPTYDNSFTGLDKENRLRIDDYRNPLCAALNITHFLGAEKVLLFCCDDSYKDERPGSEKLENGLYSYPQHKIQHEIVDQICKFIKDNDNYVEIKDFSSGWRYSNIDSVKSEDIVTFFD